MEKLTQKSNTQDRNNCTVLALKSVTGWQERKCSRILSEGGRRQNKGFDIEGFIADRKGKLNDIQFEVVYAKYDHYARTKVTHLVAAEFGIKIGSREYYNTGREFHSRENELAKELGFSMVEYGEKPMTLKRFAKENPKGAFYIIINRHALAIIDGVIVDNLTGKLGGEGRQIMKAYKVTGNIKPNIGVVSRLDTKPKRHARLQYNEVVQYVGPTYKYKGQALMKAGDYVKISTQQHNGLVVVQFHKQATKYEQHPSMPSVRIPLDGYGISVKFDRADFEVTKLREQKYYEPLKGNYKRLANDIV